MATHRELHRFTNAQLKVFTHGQLNTLSIDDLVIIADASISVINERDSNLAEKLDKIQKFFRKLYLAYKANKLVNNISADTEVDANNETAIDAENVVEASINLDFNFDFKEALSYWVDVLMNKLSDL